MSKFIGVDEMMEVVRDTDPFSEFFHPEGQELDGEAYVGRKVRWISSPGKMVRIPRDNVLFMEGNIWNWNHAAAIYDYVLHNYPADLEAPAARVYRITAKAVKVTQKYARNGTLEEQMGMQAPWERSDIGHYYAQLLDGNHRAIAALAAYEPFIWVYCAENSLPNVRKADLE